MEAPKEHYWHDIFFKAIVGLVAIFSFRWMAKIFKGEDNEFSVREFGRFIGTIFFVSAGAYMIYKEGTRQHEWEIYSEMYIAVVFGSLLGVLHLDYIFDKIVEALRLLVDLKGRKAPQITPDKPDTTSSLNE